MNDKRRYARIEPVYDWRLEEKRNEFGQVLAPHGVGVGAFGGAPGVFDLGGFEIGVEIEGARVDEVVFAAGEPDQGRALFEAVEFGLDIGRDGGGEGPDGAELIEMVHADGERLAATHGEAGDGGFGL